MARPGGAQASPVKRRIPYGAALEYQHFISDADYKALFVNHCDMIFPMNSLKWSLLQRAPGEFDYLPAEGIVSFAETHGRGTYGHTFVWYTALPAWVEEIDTAARARQTLIDHVRSVAAHFAGRVPSWDVVNEVVAHDPVNEGPWRDSLWMRLLGPSHVDTAFAAAAEAAPEAELAINDYDLEFRGARYDARRRATLDLVRRLQDRNLRIDAIGVQGHLYPEIPIAHKEFGRFIKDLKALGVGYRITELDVIDWKLPINPSVRDEMAAEHVDNFLDAAFSADLPRSLSTWGLSDRYSWIADVMPHRRGAKNRPLPFDDRLKPKPMHDVIQRYLAV
ncbi:MAG: endo-1,4-beta-xylanase [Hyphomicrobiales bacterium]|nr:endo-1,4-beta-xylanase [Hyphomicrobiales bacterium]MCP5000762.1 endo-1,4-beta-xylanase [Hyphomicrobiales bacterium]